MGAAALRRPRAASATGALIAAAASALCLGEAAAGDVAAARASTAPRRVAQVERLSDAELAPRLEALYYLGWAENYLEHYDDAIAHVDRGIAIARATGEGRLLVPMMLVKGYPFEMQGRIAEAVELCEAAVEATRLSASPHYLFWALFELGVRALLRGRPRRRDRGRRGERPRRRPDGRRDDARRRAADPAGSLGMRAFRGRRARAGLGDRCAALGGDDLAHKIPVERCFDWEVLALVALARGRREAADGYARRAEEHAASARPAAAGRASPGARARPSCSPRGDAAAAAALAAESARARRGRRARGCRPRSRSPWRPRACRGRRARAAAIAALREAESELDACGSLRVRDEMRRELRSSAPAPSRAGRRRPATPASER